MMSTGFSPPESSSLSTEQPMGERAAAMTTVVEHQGSASRGHSRQSSSESSRSSSERKGVKESNINRKGTLASPKQRASEGRMRGEQAQ